MEPEPRTFFSGFRVGRKESPNQLQSEGRESYRDRDRKGSFKAAFHREELVMTWSGEP